MKILYHHRTRAADGCRVHIEEMVSSLRGLGHDVIMVAPHQSRGEPSPTKHNGIVPNLRRRVPAAFLELLEIAYAVYAFFRLFAAWWRVRPDVLYERYNLFTPTGTWLRRLVRIPVILEVNSPMVIERRHHGGLSLLQLADWTERVSWRGADHVLPVTGVLSGYIEAAGVAKDHITVIPNGITGQAPPSAEATAAKRTAMKLDNGVVIGFTGFVRDWHRLDLVVEALAAAETGHNLHLLLVGDGPARAGIEALAKERGVSDRVTVTGVVPHEEVAGYVALFDVAVQPAVTAYASPLKLFEYMQAGKAIIAPDQPNIREVLTDGHDAVFFDPAKPDTFFAALLTLCQSPDLRATLGGNARQTIDRRDFTWNGNARRVAALAARLVDHRLGTTSSRP